MNFTCNKVKSKIIQKSSQDETSPYCGQQVTKNSWFLKKI